MDIACVAPGLQVQQDAHQIPPHGAADAAVVHLDDLLVALHQQVVVDALFAEFVLDDGDFQAMIVLQDLVQQRGLAAAQKAGQDGGRDKLVCHVTPSAGRPHAGNI